MPLLDLSVLIDYRKGGDRQLGNDMQQRSLKSHVNDRRYHDTVSAYDPSSLVKCVSEMLSDSFI